jgi:hypothetical protein
MRTEIVALEMSLNTKDFFPYVSLLTLKDALD